MLRRWPSGCGVTAAEAEAEAAPAKVNLSLRITGRRADGYHELQSLVVFAAVADRVTIRPGGALSLAVSGPLAAGVPADAGNLVLKAAGALQRARGLIRGADIALEKHLPHGAGLGGGSSDAAAALKALARHWGVAPLGAPAALRLGADVPACLAAPAPLVMEGIGERLAPAPALPEGLGMVLVNPRRPVPTAEVFARRTGFFSAPMALPERFDFTALCRWAEAAGNDLMAPARQIAPVIDRVLVSLTLAPASGLSGSGATCWGLHPSAAGAEAHAARIAMAEPDWWVWGGAVRG